jgi:Putative prokaryotic signal transducing protein
MTINNEIKWVVVYEADGEMDAEIIKGLLNANGIECFIDESGTTHEITGTPANVNVPVRVREKDAPTAIELINSRPPIESDNMPSDR